MATSKAASNAATTAVAAEKRPRAKLDTIREIERQMQKLWADLKIFEADAPGHTTDK
jgi:hypothetical protein